MKNLVTLIFIVSTINLLAQNFEGIMKWKTTMEFSDTKMKAKLEGASKQMNDPATQMKMEEMKKQMENPQMKAMMEKNPQMKAQMEQMMAASSNGGSMMPTGITVKMKNGNVLSKIEGGMVDNMEVLFLKDKAQSFRLDRKNKTFTPMASAKTADKSNVKVTKTSEVTKILNYNCIKYLVETTENGNPRSQVYWATNEIKDWDIKSMAQQRMGRNAMFLAEIDGVPLKIEANSPEGKMIMEAIEMLKGSINDSEFSIPADFKELKDNFSVK